MRRRVIDVKAEDEARRNPSWRKPVLAKAQPPAKPLRMTATLGALLERKSHESAAQGRRTK